MSTIEIDHVGPIERLTIPVPEAGGVVLLKGRNGSGKSHALAGVQSLNDAAVRRTLRPQDGAVAGTIEGLGVRVRLGRSNTARGELVVTSLDSSLDPGGFVDPGLKDPELADARRLQVLARLANIKVAREEWLAMLGGVVGVEVLGIGPEDLDSDDCVATADKLRRRLHDHARRIEQEINRLQAAADAAGLGLPDDLPESVNIDAAHQKAAEALSRVADLKRQQQQACEALARIQQAKDSISAIQLPAIDELERTLEAERVSAQRWGSERALIRQQIEELSVKLASLDRVLEDSGKEERRLLQQIDEARKMHKRVKHLTAIVSADPPKQIDQDEIAAAELERAKAKIEVEEAIKLRDAIERKRDWQRKVDEIKHQRKVAEKIRDIARSTDTAIERALVGSGFTGVSIVQGRLCVKTDRGTEPVSELSHGERWRLALDIASRGLGKGALLAVCQEAWESLDPTNRRAVAEMARERGIVLVTAEASEGELRAESF